MPYVYCFASMDFMFEGYGKTGLDAHTYIHETGHAMGLNDYYSEFAGSTSNKADSYPCELSGGQQQRVAIARALCRQADIYIFDEPFNGIDQKNVEKTAEIIREVTRDKTVLLVTHDRDQAEILGATIVDISESI